MAAVATHDASLQAATIDRFVEGWKINSGEAWTELWADGCTNTILPFSLNCTPMSKSDVIRSKHFSNISNWKLEVYEILHDTAKGKSAIYATSSADTRFGDFKWAQEYAAFITLTEDRMKIGHITEMVDTAFFAEMGRQSAKFAAAGSK
ncbi:uncharacterized protein TrAFT101_006388 [Trichoderma asperellum]|uniref:SnoaL-like domain-containing protein n=1 Tax=Trichoderma asperellum (strain ATCC 204424 / CBS 433.97 / NBRC 101777) TaxID=1042311 RepID=A0A2T3YR91_TRIA4|nr:hypothetical protein M441DRAFT_205598 [Trichoderma asperellum CBS 433.97]PTB35082.1 hypothetical protein M441DRAFT_205598 [Trichoderma asperellum CBS 433.97]UKZ91410.1 hypothetical protein TrAFT101_006388 [Trichoderma asperellum]